jgi:hypothetical protein
MIKIVWIEKERMFVTLRLIIYLLICLIILIFLSVGCWGRVKFVFCLVKILLFLLFCCWIGVVLRLIEGNIRLFCLFFGCIKGFFMLILAIFEGLFAILIMLILIFVISWQLYLYYLGNIFNKLQLNATSFFMHIIYTKL